MMRGIHQKPGGNAEDLGYLSRHKISTFSAKKWKRSRKNQLLPR
jgi:hypothetical protein